MSSDVVLSAAMRSNLLSLQSTQKLVDLTQNRLATGKKVNSALDNPQSFFASQALTNRANDLTRLLDNIGQSIQVIKAADNGITALTKLVEQADSIATQARDALAAGEAEAKATGNIDLRNVDDLTTIPGGAAAGASIQISITDPTDPTNTTTRTVAVGGTIESFVTAINNIRDGDSQKIVEASLDAGGKLQIRTTNGGDLTVDFTTTAGTDAEQMALAQGLGFGNIAKLTSADGTGDPDENMVSFTQVAGATMDTGVIKDAAGDIATRSTLITNLRNENGVAMFNGVGDDDTLTIRINGGSSVEAIDLGDGSAHYTLQGVIDQINTNDNLKGKIEAVYDEKTGVFSLRALDGTVESIELGLRDLSGADTGAGSIDLGFVQLTAASAAEKSVRFGAAAAELAGLEKDFDRIRDQITELVSNGDTGYRGTNLLMGDDLQTMFNEDRTSSLTTTGVTFTADGLGLEEANFSRKATVDRALDLVRGALQSVRQFGSTLANDLAVIQTRQDFTSNLVNTLKEGSDLLVNADQNEEGAKLLALQTRQSLGVTSLSLASQSQQSILRLF